MKTNRITSSKIWEKHAEDSLKTKRSECFQQCACSSSNFSITCLCLYVRLVRKVISFIHFYQEGSYYKIRKELKSTTDNLNGKSKQLLNMSNNQFFKFLPGVIILILCNLHLNAQKYHSNDLIPVASFGKYRAIGVAVNSNNRLFVSFPKRGDDYEYGLTEIINGQRIPYPNAEWNKEGDLDNHFASVQDLFVDAEDYLWVLDSQPSASGSIFGNSSDEAKQEGHFKLLKINTQTNQIERIYTFDDLDKTTAGLNDIKVDTKRQLGYLSDPGVAAIVVLDLKTKKTRRVLEKTKFTMVDPDVILRYNGKEMRNRQGKPFRSNVNGIALTKDFKYFYFKPINQTHLYRIETRYLADESLSEEELESYVQDMGEVGITHGLESDAKGNIFLSTSIDYSVKYLQPDGTIKTLVQDSRLLWPDSFGIGTDGYLYFSCAQLMNEPQWNNGQSKAELPYTVYKVKLP